MKKFYVKKQKYNIKKGIESIFKSKRHFIRSLRSESEVSAINSKSYKERFDNYFKTSWTAEKKYSQICRQISGSGVTSHRTTRYGSLNLLEFCSEIEPLSRSKWIDRIFLDIWFNFGQKYYQNHVWKFTRKIIRPSKSVSKHTKTNHFQNRYEFSRRSYWTYLERVK